MAAARPAPRVLVIGAGVVGLTTALAARRAGYEVTVVAEAFAPDITSVVAGALWEWPPAVCGHHRDEESVERSKAWCMDSYNRFRELARDRSTGVHLREAVFYFRRPVERDPFQHAKMRELSGKVREFRHDSALIDENAVAWDSGAVDAYSYLAPMIDTEHYMAWLLLSVRRVGCTVLQGRIEGPLVGRERELLRQFSADAIVNCTGLGAVQLAGEDMYPLRGALIHVHNDGRSMPRITKAHCMAFEESVGGQNMVFIVPRGEDRLVLGGLVEPHRDSLDLTLDDYQPLREMRHRCEAFMPVLQKATLLESDAVRVGLRPARERGVQLSREPGTRIVHNVGHGGSGVTFSWGCADEVVRHLADIVGGLS